MEKEIDETENHINECNELVQKEYKNNYNRV